MWNLRNYKTLLTQPIHGIRRVPFFGGPITYRGLGGIRFDASMKTTYFWKFPLNAKNKTKQNKKRCATYLVHSLTVTACLFVLSLSLSLSRFTLTSSSLFDSKSLEQLQIQLFVLVVKQPCRSTDRTKVTWDRTPKHTLRLRRRKPWCRLFLLDPLPTWRDVMNCNSNLPFDSMNSVSCFCEPRRWLGPEVSK